MIRVKRNDVMSYECQELQNAANDVDLTLEERDEAAEQLARLADAKDAHAQYIIGTAYRNGGLLILDTVKARKLLERAAAQEIDRKRLQELQRKRIALGHKPDDHELEPQGYTMQFH